MFHFKHLHFSSFRRFTGILHTQAPLLPSISFPFLLGLISGSAIGLYSNVPQELLSLFGPLLKEPESSSFFLYLWSSGRFVLVALILSTGFLGVALLPLLCILRSFCFACSVSALLQTPSVPALLFALCSFGVSALFSFPGFLLAASDAFRISAGFLSHDRRCFIRDIPLLRHFMFVLLFLLIDSLYLTYVQPALLELLL